MCNEIMVTIDIQGEVSRKPGGLRPYRVGEWPGKINGTEGMGNMKDFAMQVFRAAGQDAGHDFIADGFGVAGIIVPDHDGFFVHQVLKNFLSIIFHHFIVVVAINEDQVEFPVQRREIKAAGIAIQVGDIRQLTGVDPMLLDIFIGFAHSFHFLSGKVQRETFPGHGSDISHTFPPPGTDLKETAIFDFPGQLFQQGQVGRQRAPVEERERGNRFVEIPEQVPGHDHREAVFHAGPPGNLSFPVPVIIQDFIEKPGIPDNLSDGGDGFGEFGHELG